MFIPTMNEVKQVELLVGRDADDWDNVDPIELLSAAWKVKDACSEALPVECKNCLFKATLKKLPLI